MRDSVALALLGFLAAMSLYGRDEIPPQRAQQIFEAAPLTPQVKPQKPRRVLIWITRPHLMEKDPHKGYCIPYGTHAFETLGKKTGAYEPIVTDDLAMLLPENIQQFDAIVLNNASGPWITPTDADMQTPAFQRAGQNKEAVEQLLRKSFLDFISGGRGLVSIHFAIGANRHWPEFRELLGGTFTGHPWNEEISVTVEEPEHAVARGLGNTTFRIADEIYEYGPPFDRSKLRVLLSLDPAQSNMGVKWINRKDDDFALAWVKSYGKGRVFNTSFGHRTEIYWNKPVLQLYLNAIQYAVGDLAAETQPRPAPHRVIAGREPAPELPGFVRLDNGRNLDGWEGDPRFWSVRDGIIVGQTVPALRLTENNFLVWKDEIEDFELRLKYKLEGGNSGIYYRARKRPTAQTKGDPIIGAQADFSADGRWTGVIMEYTLRDVLAERGQKVQIDETGRKTVVGSLGDARNLLDTVKTNDWNDYTIIARGGNVKLAINGVPMCELEDRDPKRLVRGWLALQVHVGPPMRVQFKDVYLKRF